MEPSWHRNRIKDVSYVEMRGRFKRCNHKQTMDLIMKAKMECILASVLASDTEPPISACATPLVLDQDQFNHGPIWISADPFGGLEYVRSSLFTLSLSLSQTGSKSWKFVRTPSPGGSGTGGEGGPGEGGKCTAPSRTGLRFQHQPSSVPSSTVYHYCKICRNSNNRN